MFTHSRFRTLSLTMLAAMLFALAGCSDSTDPGEGQISEEARQEALALTADALNTDRALETARTVEMLTGGFAEGLADDAAGLNVELGDEIQGLDGAGEAALGKRLAHTQRALQRSSARMRDYEIAAQKSAQGDPQPGDLLFRYEETNFDGSITVASVYQDDPLAVVKVVFETTWPERHWLLDRASETVFIDRGADFANESDDIWLSYRGEVVFAGGERIVRELDERDSGGVQANDRVEVVSIFTPRPNHPRLLQIRTNLVVDIHELDNENDDRFVSAERVTTFTGTAHDGGSPRVIESLVPENPLAEGEEPCGGELSRTVHFRSDRRIASWTDTASFSCAGEGQLSRSILYADGSEASLSLSQVGDGPVQLDALERDGTHTTGSFDENAGSFSLSTDYPQGNDPVSRSVSGRVFDNDTAWELDESVIYADGFEEINHLEGSEDENGTRLAGSHAGRDETVEFELSANPDETVLTGHIENDQDQMIDFRLEELADGGRLLDYTAVDGAVRVEGHLEIDAEGCGEGTLIVTEGDNTVTIDVSFCDETLVDEDENLSVSL